MEEVRYMISEASKRVDVESHVLRYWQTQLELPISRNEMDQRYYKETDIELLKKVKHLKEQGFQLKAIKMLLTNLNMPDSTDSAAEIKLMKGQEDKVIEMFQENKQPVKEEETTLNTKENYNNIDKGTSLSVEGGYHNKEDGTSMVTEEEHNKEEETSLITEGGHELKEVAGSKMGQFKAIMNHIITSALKENNGVLSGEISSNVTEGVIREMNYLMRLQEEKEEERYKKFDATLREYQKSRVLAAATIDKNRKKSKFFKKNKVYI